MILRISGRGSGFSSGNWIDPSSSGKFRKVLREGSHCWRRGIEANVMFVRGEGDQYPPIGKRGHPPLQAFLGPGCSGTNTRTHFTQFLLSLFGGDMDVLGDAFRSRFFGTHGFILSQLARPKAPLRQIVIKQSAEVRRLWEEPRDSRKTSGDSVGIPAMHGGEDVKLKNTEFSALV